MGVLPKSVSTAGVVMVGVGAVALAPSTQLPTVTTSVRLAAATAPLMEPENPAAGVFEPIESLLGPLAGFLIPPSAGEPLPVPPELIIPEVGELAPTLRNTYEAAEPWARFGLDAFLYVGGWVPPVAASTLAAPVGLCLQICDPLYTSLEPAVRSAVFNLADIIEGNGSVAENLGEFATDAIDALLTLPGAVIVQLVNGLGFGLDLGALGALTDQVPAAAPVAAGQAERSAAAPTELGGGAVEHTTEALPDNPLAAAGAVGTGGPADADGAAGTDRTTPIVALEPPTALEPTAERTTPEAAEQAGEDVEREDDGPAAVRAGAGGPRAVPPSIAAVDALADATAEAKVQAQGEVRGGNAGPAAVDGAASDGGTLGDTVADTRARVIGGLRSGGSALHGAVRKVGDQVRSALGGGKSDSDE